LETENAYGISGVSLLALSRRNTFSRVFHKVITFSTGNQGEQATASIRNSRSVHIQLENGTEVKAAEGTMNKGTSWASKPISRNNRATLKLKMTTERTSRTLGCEEWARNHHCRINFLRSRNNRSRLDAGGYQFNRISRDGGHNWFRDMIWYIWDKTGG